MTESNVTPAGRHNQSALIDCSDFIRGIVQTALQEFLNAEMTEFIGANRYERTDERMDYRNGYKSRTLILKVGAVYLRIPQTRDGSFHTELFARYQRSERALTLAIIEMWVNGVSTRKVAAVTEELSSVGFSKSAVSELCKSLDVAVDAWKARSLSAHTYPYLFVDALYEDIRTGGTVTSEGVLIACGIRDDGRREILDVAIADTESAAAYNDLFSSLRERGVSGVMCVTSDAHSGLKSAVKRYFQGATWQRCQVHFMRDAMGKVSLRYRGDLAKDIGSIFECESRDAAMKRAADVADTWRNISGRAAKMIDEDIEQCLSILAFPKDHQIHIRTSNILERFIEEIRRRSRVVGIFPNEAAALRLISTICIDKSEEWIQAKPYLDMSLLYVDDEPALAVILYLKAQGLRCVS